jgi:hypothetical protein
MARSNLAGIVSTVASDGGNRTIYLIEQRANLRCMVDGAVRRCRRDDLPGVRVHSDVELAPRPPCLCAVLLKQPFARTAQFQPRAFHQQAYGIRAWSRTEHFQRPGPAAQSGVVRHRKIEAERAMMEPISPSVCRRAKRNTDRRVSAVAIARLGPGQQGYARQRHHRLRQFLGAAVAFVPADGARTPGQLILAPLQVGFRPVRRYAPPSW